MEIHDLIKVWSSERGDAGCPFGFFCLPARTFLRVTMLSPALSCLSWRDWMSCFSDSAIKAASAADVVLLLFFSFVVV